MTKRRLHTGINDHCRHHYHKAMSRAISTPHAAFHRRLPIVIAPFVAVVMLLVIVVNAFGLPLGGRWHEEDGGLCPIGADWLVPIDQMRFAVPEGGQTVLEKPHPGTIPDEGGQCYFVSFDTATISGNAPITGFPALTAIDSLIDCAFRIAEPMLTDKVPAYYPHGPPPLKPRAAICTTAPRAPPACS